MATSGILAPMLQAMPVIVGVPRSGTTLLRMMIDAHPVAIPPETGFLPLLADLDPRTDNARCRVGIITGFPTWPDFQLDAGFSRRARSLPTNTA